MPDFKSNDDSLSEGVTKPQHYRTPKAGIGGHGLATIAKQGRGHAQIGFTSDGRLRRPRDMENLPVELPRGKCIYSRIGRCDEDSYTRGYCIQHYYEYKRQEGPYMTIRYRGRGSGIHARTICSTDGCDGTVDRYIDLCQRCYKKKWTRGDDVDLAKDGRSDPDRLKRIAKGKGNAKAREAANARKRKRRQDPAWREHLNQQQRDQRARKKEEARKRMTDAWRAANDHQ